jgi:hypothetical protein
MRAAEIVERDVQAHGGKVAVDLFGEAVAVGLIDDAMGDLGAERFADCVLIGR